MTNPPSAATPYRYKAFISYSHAADGKLAPALQAALQRFAKPWYRFRAMRVFRDETGLAVTPELWGPIQAALEQSEYFILLASPLAAASTWVQDEVTWWLANRSADRLLIVLTDGEIAWDATASDFDWSRTNALPRCLQKAWKGVPHFGDLRWAKGASDLSLRQPRFLEETARLAATLLDRPLDDLIGEYRKAMRLLRTAATAVALLTVAVCGAIYVSYRANRAANQLVVERRATLAMQHEQEEAQRRQAEDARQLALQTQHREAGSIHLAAQAAAVFEEDPQLSMLLALEAVHTAPTREAERALRHTLVGFVAPLVLQGHAGPVDRAQFGSDGTRVLTSSADGTVRLWDAATGTAVLTLRVCKVGDRFNSADGILSADGKTVLTMIKPSTLAVGYWDEGSVQLHDATTGDVLFSVPDQYAVGAALSPDGTQIVTAGFNSAVRVWNAPAGTIQVELAGHQQRVVSASFSAKGNWIVTSSWDGTARVWNVATGQSLAVLQAPKPVEWAAFTPDGARVVTLGDDGKDLRLWDWANSPGSAVAFVGHQGPIQDVAVSPDGKWLATASTDTTARIWETANGNCRQVLQGHDDAVNGVAFSPDGKWLVTASGDKTARIWEVATGEQLTELGWNQSPRTSVAFSPDGKRIVTGTVDGAAPVYTCTICGPVEDLVARARARTTRELTLSEKQQYLTTLQ